LILYRIDLVFFSPFQIDELTPAIRMNASVIGSFVGSYIFVLAVRSTISGKLLSGWARTLISSKRRSWSASFFGRLEIFV
jgi:uncharacterized membrane protein YjjP (DUF1212 family)